MTYRADIEHIKQQKKRRWRTFSLSVVLIGLTGLIIAGVFGWRHYFTDLPELPDTETFWTVGRKPSMEMRDQNGQVILHRGPYYGKVVDPDLLPAHVIDAFLAGEDQRFFNHGGFDPAAIFRAAIANLQAGYTVQGGSTLTQQLIKTTLLSPEQTVKRKLQEVYLAMELEERLSKEEILSLYLSRIYLGRRAYGLDAAAKIYFGKTAYELSLAEASFLAALPKAPSKLSNEENFSLARLRQHYVLTRMAENGFVSWARAQAAMDEPLEFAPRPPPENGNDLGYIADYVQSEMNALLPNAPYDAVVTITLDTDIQAYARQTLVNQLESKGQRYNVSSGAVVTMALDGRVLALIGGTDYQESKFNRAIQAMRQPGSAFKPFVYSAAMEIGLTPETIRVDQRKYITANWAPRNYTNTYVGPVMLKDALAHSLNTVAAQLTKEVGADSVAHMAHRLGLGTSLSSIPSIALGANETTLFDMTRAFGTFAKDGKRLDPYIIERIEDTRGTVLYERKPYPGSTVLNARIARDMDTMLRRVVTNGSGHRADIPSMRVAGKTGTSQNWRDAWFIGYTPNYVTGVWMGNDDNSPMRRVTGGFLPAETWKTVMVGLKEQGLITEAPWTGEPKPLSERNQRRASFYAGLSAAFEAHKPEQFSVQAENVN